MIIFLATLAGAGIGAGVGLVLSLAGEILDCLTCGGCGTSDGTPTFLFCLITGAVIGLIVGLVKYSAQASAKAAERDKKLSEEEHARRVKWAGEVKQRALSIANTCEKNSKEFSPLISTTYKAGSQMSDIISELANVTELKGKVDAMADDTKTKGGASK